MAILPSESLIFNPQKAKFSKKILIFVVENSADTLFPSQSFDWLRLRPVSFSYAGSNIRQSGRSGLACAADILLKTTLFMISLGIFGIEPAVFAIVALLTGVALVALAMWLAGLISPRSFNPQKGEAYECGIPTRGESMTRFHVGYYLFAILFLMFDVETVFLFPWAVNLKGMINNPEIGGAGVGAVAVFFAILVLGLVYAWRKGALEWK